MSACTNPEFLKVLYFFTILIDIVKIVVPIGLIIMGTIGFSKSVVTSDEEVQKKSVILFFKRIVLAVLIFAMPWIIELIFASMGKLTEDVIFTDCLLNANSECIDSIENGDISGSACFKYPDEPYDKDSGHSSGGGGGSGSSSNITSDSSITFSYEFVSDKDNISYGLYTPSTAYSNKKTPLILWLHGSGEIGASANQFKESGLLKVLNGWTLEKFNAYVLCPLLPGDSDAWNDVKTEVYTLLDRIIKEKNIDTNNIVLVGHSLGSLGIYSIANGKTSYYSALVFLSDYPPSSSIDINQFKSLPVRGYLGGEDYERPSNHMNQTWVNNFGKENLFELEGVNHPNVPKKAFYLDENGDNKSDLIEWMLTR